MKTLKSISTFLPDSVFKHITDPAIQVIGEKLIQGERLTPDDGLACFNTRDLIGLGQIASAVKQSRYGDKAFIALPFHPKNTPMRDTPPTPPARPC